MGGKTETEPAFKPVHGTFIHVEFSAPDLKKASAFYGALFGWQFMDFQPKEMYFMTPGNAGPCGCLLEGKPAGRGTILYVNVDDIPSTVRKAESLGARAAKPKTEIPGGHGFYAHIEAPDGNLLGVYCGR